MISLRRSLTELDKLTEQRRLVLEHYLGAIGSVERHAVEINPQDVLEHRKALRLIRQALDPNPAEEALKQSGLELDAELLRYSKRAASVLKAREQEIRAILDMLAEAARTITARNDSYSMQFREVARELDAVSGLSSLSEIRARLTEGVTRLRSCTEAMQREELESVVQLQRELLTFQHRLEEAESLAATDPLTGLANRREAEKLMRRRCEAGAPFCIMVFDLDHFKLVNDRYGHHVGDRLLKAFAKRLAGHYRADDVVCRWGGDEFLVVLSASLPDVLGRARDVAEHMGGLYALQSPKGAINIQLSVSVGASQYGPGASSESLFAEADASLYQHKSRRGQIQADLEDELAPTLPSA